MVGTTGAFLLGPFVIERFYDAELSGRTLADAGAVERLLVLALATAQAVIALHGHTLVALDGRSASLPGSVADIGSQAGIELFFGGSKTHSSPGASRRWTRSRWR